MPGPLECSKLRTCTAFCWSSTFCLLTELQSAKSFLKLPD